VSGRLEPNYGGRTLDFQESGLIVEKYDGITQHETIKLDQVMVWIRINRIPELMRKKEIV
jgi:hypothetical protein